MPGPKSAAQKVREPLVSLLHSQVCSDWGWWISCLTLILCFQTPRTLAWTTTRSSTWLETVHLTSSSWRLTVAMWVHHTLSAHTQKDGFSEYDKKESTCFQGVLIFLVGLRWWDVSSKLFTMFVKSLKEFHFQFLKWLLEKWRNSHISCVIGL